MHKHREFFFIAFILLLSTHSKAQQYWANSSNRQDIGMTGNRVLNNGRFLKLDFNRLQRLLADAPHEEAIGSRGAPVRVALPLPDGSSEAFDLYQTEVMHPDLAAKFPEIQTFKGSSTSHPGKFAYVDLSPNGLHAVVYGKSGESFVIEPVSSQANSYVSYFRNAIKKPSLALSCHTDDEKHLVQTVSGVIGERAGDCKVRRFRLAVSCTGEYTQFHGGTASLAMAAIVTAINNINAIYEKQCGITMQLVANNNLIVYTNPATDPFTNDDPVSMLNENQTNIDNVIGSANYDIGHVFGVGYGGIAYIGVVCTAGYKAQGVSTHPYPVGDGFEIDIASHELGHQFGALHSHYSQTSGCLGSVTTASNYEPGSGSTIMSYAGICDPSENVQSYSDPYFHAHSLKLIGDFVSGTTCGTILTTLSKPVANAGADIVIPKGTPFELSGASTLPSGFTATYSWEQMNNEVLSTNTSGGYTGYPMPPKDTSKGGPTFRSLSPASIQSRSFPSLASLTSGNHPWEVISNTTRVLKFRYSVRGVSSSNYGCMVEDDMNATLVTAGPFNTIYPTANTTVSAGTSITLTWAVNNTNVSPVNCTSVQIFLSLDNGGTFPYVLSPSTANNGSKTVTLPSLTNNYTNARVLIKSVNSVFYALSPKFSINASGQNLPVELVSFQAFPQSRSIRLEWVTANEQDNKGFQIERSLFPDRGFEVIGWVNPEHSKAYGFNDQNVRENTLYYYRLRQIDLDGEATLSNIVTARIEDHNTFGGNSIFLSPNPASEQVRVSVNGVIVPEVDLAVYTANGMLIKSGRYALDLNNEAVVNTDDLQTGIYFVKVRAARFQLSQKLVIQKEW